MIPPPIKLQDLSKSSQKTWTDDVLHREEYARGLSCVLNCHGAPMTVAVNGVWGSGKTFLLSRWADDLARMKCHVVKINAWNDDFAEDPLTVVAGQFVKSLGGFERFVISLPGLKGRVLWVLSKIGLGFVKNWAKHIALRWLYVDVDKIVKSELQSKTWGQMESYEQVITAKEEFRQKLEEFSERHYLETPRPIVFIVDEVDRCKPTFAVALLERIKHLMNVKHTVFILGVDIEQLGKTIRSVYGDIDVDNYLRRFIDMRLDLPEPEYAQYIDLLWRRYQIDEFLQTFERSDMVSRESQIFKSLLCDVSSCAQLSLRELEESMRMFMLLVLSSGSDVSILPYEAAVLIVLKIRNRRLYNAYVDQNYDVDHVLEELIRMPFNDIASRRKIVRVMSVVYAAYNTEGGQDPLGRLKGFVFSVKHEGWDVGRSRVYRELGQEEDVVLLLQNAVETLRDTDLPSGFSQSTVQSCADRLECHKPFHFPQ